MITPRWSAGEWLAVGSVVVSLVVAAVLVIGVGAADSRPQAAAPSSTSRPTTTSRPKPASLVPPQIPGWVGVLSQKRNAAYDVPPSWEPSSPSRVFGFNITDEISIGVTGVSNYTESVCPPSAGGPIKEPLQFSAAAGIAGSTTPDLATAARESAQHWAWGMFRSESMPMPELTLSTAQSLLVNGKPAMKVTATVDRPACTDGRHGVVHALALAGNDAQPVVFVVGADQGMPSAVREEELQQMVMSVRVAGLDPSQCRQERLTGGTWC